jgi:hypothetical protein
MNGPSAGCDQLVELRLKPGETIMSGILTDALIAVGATGVIGYALMSHFQNGGPRSRARTGGDGGGDSCSETTNGGFSLGDWFSSDSPGSSTTGAGIAEGAATVGEAVAAIRLVRQPILIQRNPIF